MTWRYLPIRIRRDRRSAGAAHAPGLRADRRGAVALLFAMSMLTVMVSVGAAINMAQFAHVRALLQGAVDNAALAGAAAYAKSGTNYSALAQTIAVQAFCNAIVMLPPGASVTAQSGGGACGSAAGPLVSVATDSYIPGTPGISHGAGVSCNGAYLPAAPYKCGFIVTVSTNVMLAPVLSFIFGSTTQIVTSAMAVNPFIALGDVFSLPNGIVSGAKYANSMWVYPLALDASGNIDYSSNAGALPDTSACTGGPDQVACGDYVMLASTMYAASGFGYTPPDQSTTYDNGVVRNPLTPTLITATTPLGIAFRSIAGGNYVQYSPPGVYGYQVTNLGASPPTYVYAPNGCIYPYNNLAYQTVGQVWQTVTTTSGNSTSTSYVPVLPWSLVTHWFYSSYLTQNLPPSEGEIEAQTANNEDIPSVPADPAQANGNIRGLPTYNANPSPAVPSNCPSTTTKNGITTSNDTHQTTTYLTSGNNNCSLYIGVSTSSTYIPPKSSYTGSCFDPANTPGQQYAAISCQQYAGNYFTFYWNDMGGAVSDNDNYSDGVVEVGCAPVNQVHLIQ